MKFSELPIGAKFRFHRRGPVHTKTSSTERGSGGQVAPNVEVIPEEDDTAPQVPPPVTQKPDGYYGPGTRVYFLPDNRVSIVGTLGMAELNMIVNELASRLK